MSPFQPRRRAGDAALPEPQIPHEPRRLARLRLATVRVVAATLLMIGLAAMAGNVFDELEWSLFLPVVAAAVTTFLVTRLPGRVPAPARIGLVVAAVAASAVVVALIAGGSFADAIPHVIDGPRRLLTTEWPSPPDPTALATLAVLLGAATAVAVDLARRTGMHLAPLAPVLVTFVVLVALSAPRRPAWWVLAGLGVLALVLAVAHPGDRAGARLATLRGERALLVTIATVTLASVATAAAVAWVGRADPRSVADASRSSAIVRSLESTVGLREADPPIPQFTVTDESPLIGQRMPTRWRVAALTQYDGQRWVPQIEVRPIGNRLAAATPSGPDAPGTGHYRLDLLAPHTELVPLPGPPVELVGDPMPRIETDLDRVVVKLTESAAAGTTLRLVAELAPTVGDVAPAAIVVHEVNELEAAFTEVATELAGEGEALARLQRLEQALREWELDRAARGAGQQLFPIEQFVTTTRRGTDEQFVTAFVLLARSLGFEARVAMGFAVPPERATSPLTVTSEDAAAWPEVHIAGAGWVAFDPVPEDEVGDSSPPEPEPDTQTPAAAQPPVEPPARPGEAEEETDEETEAAEARWGTVATWAVRVLIGVALIALPAALALAAILIVKLTRRRRRMATHEPARQVRAAWANATDALVDAGLTIEPSWTDDRIAAMGAPHVGPVPHELRRLATLSTAATFGPAPDAETGTGAIATERELRRAMAAQLTRWQRLRWQLSLRSLRRATRSPVTV